MTVCIRCHRPLKQPTETGMGPVCSVDVSKNYHIDHIMPLALGGYNGPPNLQILCRTCNQKKYCKHPVDFMQERGFLL